MNLAEVVHASADRHRSRPAVTDVRADRSLSYEALAHEADRIAAFLSAQGVEPGQRIGLVAPNGLAYLPAAFGLLQRGGCLVPIAQSLTTAEVRDVVARVDVNGCLSWPDARNVAESAVA